MKMNNLITLTVLLVLFAACQEDVVLDLNKTEKKLVVEAYVSNNFLVQMFLYHIVWISTMK